MSENFEGSTVVPASQSGVLKWLVIALIAVTEMATDIFSPSLPRIAEYFAAPEELVQLTISGNLLGLALSSLCYGTWSDSFGRRPMLLLGFSIFVLGSIACFLAPNLTTLILARVVQGLGGGASLAVGLSTIKDVFSGEHSSQVMSQLGMVIALSPGLAPVLGGYLSDYGDWPLVFEVLAAVATLVLLLAWCFLPETHKPREHARTKAVGLAVVLTEMLRVLKNPSFLCFAAIQGIFIAFIFSEVAYLPFLYCKEFGIAPTTYGYFLAYGVAMYVVGTLVNQSVVLRWGMKGMLRVGIGLHLLSCSLIVLGAFGGVLNPYLIHGCKTFGCIGLAFVLGNAAPQALEFCKNNLGSGSSFLSFSQMLAGALISWGICQLYDGSALPLYGTSLLLGLVTFFCLCRGYSQAGTIPPSSYSLAVEESI